MFIKITKSFKSNEKIVYFAKKIFYLEQVNTLS